MKSTYYLTLSCADQPGIVAAVSSAIFDVGGNILEAQQFDDTNEKRFFMRVEFEVDANATTKSTLQQSLGAVVDQFGLDWNLVEKEHRQRVLLMVSKMDHCLVDLLYRYRIGELEMDVVGIVSNHPEEVLKLKLLGNIPFHHLPIEKDNKQEQEAALKEIINDTQAELVVLARYMQILSSDLTSFLSGRCINIHHSFLPGFKGGRPYHQAFERGVKMIGATAHYVTIDLDEGPIIVQDVATVSHTDSPNDLARKGRDIERRVLATAVHYHLQGRVLLNGNKTVVFRD